MSASLAFTEEISQQRSLNGHSITSCVPPPPHHTTPPPPPHPWKKQHDQLICFPSTLLSLLLMTFPILWHISLLPIMGWREGVLFFFFFQEIGHSSRLQQCHALLVLSIWAGASIETRWKRLHYLKQQQNLIARWALLQNLFKPPFTLFHFKGLQRYIRIFSYMEEWNVV